MSLKVSSAPHVHSPINTQRLMLYVLISLVPATVFGIVAFGLSALLVVLLSCLSAVVAELVWQKLSHQEVRIKDLSALVTGLLLGLNLPPTAPWWMAVLGSAFAIIIVKQLFGGLGDNFLNPALAARAVLLASWPVHMTHYVLPTFFSGADVVSSSTPLVMKNAPLMDLLIGNIPGCIGEVSKLAILLGFLFLVITGTISWRIPVVMTGSVFLFSWIFGGDVNMALTLTLSGGVLFGAVFMATDYVTSPMTPWGQVIYALGIGLIISVIRFYGSYPEGVTYGILLMNIATPLIDRFLPRRLYGYQKEAKKA